jgi:ubiquinone/menaquinone biosynthesis C-methylase UbiE
MRVLDLDSGLGDVAFVAAELIGPTGEIVGIERSPDTAAKANIRAQQSGLSHVRFVVGDIHDVGPAGPFDAIIGRLVLIYVPEPAGCCAHKRRCFAVAVVSSRSSSMSTAAVRFHQHRS